MNFRGQRKSFVKNTFFFGWKLFKTFRAIVSFHSFKKKGCRLKVLKKIQFRYNLHFVFTIQTTSHWVFLPPKFQYFRRLLLQSELSLSFRGLHLTGSKFPPANYSFWWNGILWTELLHFFHIRFMNTILLNCLVLHDVGSDIEVGK